MNSTARQDEADSLVGNVCAIFVCDRSAAVKIQSVQYVRFKDIQLHEFERDGLTDNDEKLDIDMYRCLNLKCFLHLNWKTSGVNTCEKICEHRFMTHEPQVHCGKGDLTTGAFGTGSP